MSNVAETVEDSLNGSNEHESPNLRRHHSLTFSDDEDSAGPANIYGKRRRVVHSMHIAVAGCSHGEMDKIYETLSNIEEKKNIKFDLLICCGDFQAIRNYGDLSHISVPPKYRQLMTFYKYYSGEKIAPILTIFVGGNHESSGYLAEMPYGGWAAPNIYYMGHASVVQIGGLRIAGLSGIFKGKDFDRGHFESPPFSPDSIKSVYHVRSVDIFRLKQLKNRDDGDSKIDMMVSHDWPAGITDFGDLQRLLRIKPFFQHDIEQSQLGNPATMDLLHELKPRRWFAAHMHVRFEAEVAHHDKEGSSTRFLALDKPLPRRSFLECFEVPLKEERHEGDEPFALHYDPEWLAILRATDFLTEATDRRVYMPAGRNAAQSTTDRLDFRPTKAEVEEVLKRFNDDFRIPLNFCHTAPPLYKTNTSGARQIFSAYYRNPQTTVFCEKLGICDLNLMLCEQRPSAVEVPYYCEMKLREQESAEAHKAAIDSADGVVVVTNNPDEIDIGLEEEADDVSSHPVELSVCDTSSLQAQEVLVDADNNFFVVDPMPQRSPVHHRRGQH